MKMKKWLALALCLCMLCQSVFVAQAEETVCPHTHVETSEQWSASPDNVTYTPVDQTYHTESGLTQSEITRCVDCGEVVSERVLAENADRQERHVYQNGVCALCGYENTCEHADAETLTRYEETDDTAYVVVDAQYHDWVHLRLIETVFCSDCAQEISSRVADEDASDRSMHTYDNGVCRFCGYENACEHADTFTGTLYRETEQTAYVTIDNQYHSWMHVQEIEWTACNDCGETLSEQVVNEDATLQQQHNYVDGVCTGCGHENTCEHADPFTDRFYRETEQSAYEAVDNKYHDWTHMQEIERTGCEACGETISEQVVVEDTTQRRSHYYEDNVCVFCGHENTCEHPNAYEATRYVETEATTYVPVDNDTHDWTHLTLIKKIMCDDCGQIVSEQVMGEDITLTIAHDYRDDVCTSCGYENVCPHENTMAWTDYAATGASEYLPVDAQYHDQTHTQKVDCVYCNDCRNMLSTNLVDLNATYRTIHSYEGDTCRLCGYVNECKHVNNYVDGGVHATDRTTYEPLNRKMHKSLHVRTTIDTYCRECDVLLSQIVQREDTTVEQSHEYDENGVCTVCGFENDCKHLYPRQSVFYVATGDSEATSLGGAGHQQTHMDEYLVKVCDECGYETCEQTRHDVTVKLPHDMEEYECDECSVCGYICEHTMDAYVYQYMDDDAEKTYTVIDKETHRVSGAPVYEDIRCWTCGADWERKLVAEDGSLTEMHQFEDGVCTGCGYTCEHAKKAWEVDWDMTKAVCVAKDSRYHEYQHCDKYETTLCPDCDMVIGRRLVAADQTRLEEHSYDDDGRCESCGYLSVCEHPQLKADSVSRADCTYEALDDIYHKAVGTPYAEGECPDCGMYVGYECPGEPKTIYEEHSYDDQGRCYRCGHVNSCEHEYRIVTRQYVADAEYTPDGEHYHIAAGRVYAWEICKDCRANMGERMIEVNGSIREAHTFEGNVCSECGYEREKECTHAHVEEYRGIEFPSATYYEYDQHRHIAIGRQTSFVRCLDCDEVLFDGVLAENVTTLEKHHFENDEGDSSNYCYQCGYIKKCSHDQGVYTQKWFGVKERYEPINNRSHYVFGVTYKSTFCNECNELLAEEFISMNDFEDEEHNYENGVCIECGYKNACKHENSDYITYFQYRTAAAQVRNENWHVLTGVMRERLVCRSCGEEFSDELLDANATKSELHDFIEDSCVAPVCIHCGYIKGTDLNLDGWREVDGKWYYYENGEALTEQWMKDSAGWCYLGSDGAMTTNAWVMDSKGWCYLGENGYAVTNCWKQDSIGWCYLDSEGSMVKNAWVQTDGKWYFLDENGYRVTNSWRKDSTGWCYLGADGAMVTNAWVMDSKGWCYLGENGYAVTNCWKQDSIGWCYLDSEGSMVKNAWITTDGKWYYLNENGYRVTNSWRKDSTGWCYLGADGAMVTNAWTQDSAGWCYMGADGYAVTNCWKHDGTGWRYLGENGSMVKNAWIQLDGQWYYLNADGYMTTGTATIDGVEYVFGADGALAA